MDRRAHIREMLEADLDAVMQIERAGQSAPWSIAQFRAELRNSTVSSALVCVPDGAIAGFAIAWFVRDEASILNIGVRPEHRRSGVASRLLAHILALAVRRGCTKVILEVRRSNTAATALYAKFGFALYGVRAGYYRDNHEDALLMKKCLPGNGARRPDTAQPGPAFGLDAKLEEKNGLV